MGGCAWLQLAPSVVSRGMDDCPRAVVELQKAPMLPVSHDTATTARYPPPGASWRTSHEPLWWGTPGVCWYTQNVPRAVRHPTRRLSAWSAPKSARGGPGHYGHPGIIRVLPVGSLPVLTEQSPALQPSGGEAPQSALALRGFRRAEGTPIHATGNPVLREPPAYPPSC